MLTDEDVREMVLEKLEGTTQKALSEEWRISAAYLNDYLHFRREPGAKILDALGLRRVARYERIDTQ